MKGGKKTLEKGRKIEVIFYFYLFIFLIIHLYFFGSETTISQNLKLQFWLRQCCVGLIIGKKKSKGMKRRK